MPRISFFVLLLGALAALAAASTPTFCKCTCGKNSTVVPLDGNAKAASSTSSANLHRRGHFFPKVPWGPPPNVMPPNSKPPNRKPPNGNEKPSATPSPPSPKLNRRGPEPPNLCTKCFEQYTRPRQPSSSSAKLRRRGPEPPNLCTKCLNRDGNVVPPPPPSTTSTLQRRGPLFPMGPPQGGSMPPDGKGQRQRRGPPIPQTLRECLNDPPEVSNPPNHPLLNGRDVESQEKAPSEANLQRRGFFVPPTPVPLLHDHEEIERQRKQFEELRRKSRPKRADAEDEPGDQVVDDGLPDDLREVGGLIGPRAAPADCMQCTKAFCLAQNLDICADATEEDVQTSCFQRDSKKDRIIVWGFIMVTGGLLLWAALRRVLERRASSRLGGIRSLRGYRPLARAES